MKVAKRIVIRSILVMVVTLFVACPPNGLLTDLQQKVREVSVQVECSLTVNATTGGIVSPQGTTKVKQGAPTAITATANSGYYFTNWTVSSGSGVGFGNANSASTTVTLTSSDATIQANFTQQTYQLTVTVPSGLTGCRVTVGTTQPTTVNAGSSATITVAAGAQTPITPTAGAGYLPSALTILSGGPTINNTTNPPYVILNSGSATVQANFTQQMYQLTVTVPSGLTGCRVTVGTTQPTTVNAGSSATITVAAGAQTPITPTAGAGYLPSALTILSDGPTINNTANPPYVILNSGSATVQANFTQIPYTVTINPTAGGTVSPASMTAYFGQPTTATFIATQNTGYNFVNWTAPSGGVSFGSANNASTTVTLTAAANETVQANFQLISYILTINNDGGSTSNPGPGKYAVYYGVPFSIQVIGTTGNRSFQNWESSGPGVAFANQTAAQTTVTLTGGDATIYPLARLGMPVTIIATPSNYSVFVVSGGNVNLNTASIDPNNPHYAFQNWSVTEGSANIAVPTNASTTATVNYGDPVLGHVQIHANYFWWN